MRAFYEKSPDTAELGLFGFPEGGFSEKEKTLDIQLYNWQTVQLFIVLATQWRVGMPGTTGLDYDAVTVVMDCHGIEPEKCKFMLRKIRAMEIEVLMMRA